MMCCYFFFFLSVEVSVHARHSQYLILWTLRLADTILYWLISDKTIWKTWLIVTKLTTYTNNWMIISHLWQKKTRDWTWKSANSSKNSVRDSHVPIQWACWFARPNDAEYKRGDKLKDTKWFTNQWSSKPTNVAPL